MCIIGKIVFGRIGAWSPCLTVWLNKLTNIMKEPYYNELKFQARIL
jgi:hypothetical protein